MSKRILRKLFYCFLAAVLIAGPSFSCAASSTSTGTYFGNPDNYNIIFLSSYSMNDEICQMELHGLQDALPETHYDLSCEFMDTRRFNTAEDLARVDAYLRNKFSRYPMIDCYVAGDDSALAYLLNRRDLVAGTPVVYLGVEDPDLLKKAEFYPTYVTGVHEKYDYQGNFDFLKKYFPKVDHISFYSGNSAGGLAEAKNFEQAAKADGTFTWNVVNVSKTSEESLFRKLEDTPETTAVFLGGMGRMKDGSVSSMSYIGAKLISHTTAPVFSLSIDLTEYGALGGMVYDCSGSAALAGEMVKKIVAGAPPSHVQPIADTPDQLIVNKQVLDRFSIRVSSMPDNAVIRDANPSFFFLYRTPIIITSVIVCLLLLLILYLALRARKQKGMLETDDVIFRRIAQEAIDFVSVITLNDGMVTLRSGTWRGDGEAVSPSGRTMPFREYIRNAALRIPDGDRRQVFLEQTDLDTMVHRLNTEGEIVQSYELPDADGKMRRKQIFLSWLNRRQGRIILFETDTTKSLEEEQKQVAALQQAAEAERSANEAKTQFISRISHDIRTPIGAVLNLTDFAVQDMNEPERLKNDLGKIATSGRFLLSLINDVLDISKINSSKIELTASPYPFREFISEIRNIIEPMSKDKGLQYLVDAKEDDFDAVLLIDRVRLNQIALNLLSNAVKYTDPGGSIVFSAELREKEASAAELFFSVKDNGIGMSDSFQQVMFDEFAQEEDNPYRSAHEAGTGLGLSIVKKLVTLMAGTIVVKSAVGEGSLFEVTLPVAIRAAETPVDGRAGQKAETAAAAVTFSGRVLLAEDNAINAEIAGRIFGAMGISCDRAANGQEELDLFTRAPAHTYLAVFQDIQMPVMNGYEAAAAIRALPTAEAATIPIIAMTADAFSDARDKAMEAGMTTFITKPLKADEIRDIISNIVAEGSREENGKES